MTIYFCRNVFLQISGKISRIVNIKAWEGTLLAPSMMDLPGRRHRALWTHMEGDTSCTLHDRTTWKWLFVHLKWLTFLKEQLTWPTYLKRTLHAPCMMELSGRETSCILHDGATWRGHLVQLTWQTYLEGTLHAPYMSELPGRDTSCNLPGGHTLCNLHDRPTWRGHFVHPTWWTYLVGTLRATYMIDLPGGDTSCNFVHLRGIDQEALLPSVSFLFSCTN